VAVLTALTPLLGGYMARVYRGEVRFLAPLERLARVDSPAAQDWKSYARAVLVFSVVSWVALYAILRTQGIHPFNPEGFDSGPWDLSFNTASSFVSNTNWQYYGGEATLSDFSQMAGLTVQNFASAAVGMAVLAAVIRGFAARSVRSLGNFWQDLVRTLLYILLPLSFAGALILVSQGVIQSLAEGPVASQVAIKQLGTNGGGFFNVNSAFPFENATAFSNFVEMLFILLIPAALTATFGRMVGNRRQGWALYAAMTAMLVAGIGVAYAAESNESPALQAAGIEEGGNLEGKEQRNGIASSAAWAVITTAASNGSVNSAHDAYTGTGGAVALMNMMTGEVIFGGVGSGLYGMLLMVLLAVFIAGLMVGRTPEYLGKKIEAREIKFTLIGVLYPALGVLVFTALAIRTKWGAPSIAGSGPQGFSETLYAYTSQGNNNGSAFAGYTGFVQPNAPGNVGAFGITFADIMGGLAMLAARFVPLMAVLAVAGSLAAKRVSPAGPGTFRTDTLTFVSLLIFVIVIVAALTFFPALLLGPVVQALSTQLF
jgi:potassium-transporting ATPase potassium-binding subunit